MKLTKKIEIAVTVITTTTIGVAGFLVYNQNKKLSMVQNRIETMLKTKNCLHELKENKYTL